MSGLEVLDEMIAQVRAVGRGLDGPELAKEVAPLLEAEAKRTVAAGMTPDGQPWKAKKRGGRPLVHAAKAVSARVLGPVVELVVQGVEALHHLGTKSLPRRPMIPDRGVDIPKAFADRIREAAAQAFARAMGSS